MEREYVSGDMSLRELCRKHDISAHSLVVAQAQKGRWQEKRERFRAKVSESFITHHAEKRADRQAVVESKALDAIDEALDRFRGDMHATEKTRIDGEWVEVPVMRLMPKDVAVLLDRLQMLFERPSRISEGRDLSVRSELPIDAPEPDRGADAGEGSATDITAAEGTSVGRLTTPAPTPPAVRWVPTRWSARWDPAPLALGHSGG